MACVVRAFNAISVSITKDFSRSFVALKFRNDGSKFITSIATKARAHFSNISRSCDVGSLSVSAIAPTKAFPKLSGSPLRTTSTASSILLCLLFSFNPKKE